MTVKDIPGYANLINLDYLKPLNEVLTRDTGDFNGINRHHNTSTQEIT